MAFRTATCACGQLRISCKGDPVRVSVCHCLACQKRTGSPFGIAAFFPTKNAAPSGKSRVYIRNADSGFVIKQHFCGSCGSTVYWYLQRMPERIAVAVGAFADPEFPPPSQSVHEESRHGWVTVPE